MPVSVDMSLDEYSAWWLVGALCLIVCCEAWFQSRSRDDVYGDEDEARPAPPASSTATTQRLINIEIKD